MYRVGFQILEVVDTSVCFFNCRVHDKISWILDATRQHSTNLAKFVFLYKSITKLLAWSEGTNREFHSGLAAFVGGYIIFGKKTSVNEQVSITKA